MKKILGFTSSLFMFAAVLLPLNVAAQGINIDFNDNPLCENETYRENNPEECPVNLDTVTLPTFISFETIQNFSIFSYIVFALNLLFLGLTLIWIFMIVSAAFEYISSQGDPEKIQASNKKISNIFVSITILIVGFVILVIVASFFGFGNFLDWPKVLSQCEDGSLYLTKTLELEAENSGTQPVTDEQIAAACFN